MKSDLTRLTFLPDPQFIARQYSRVLIQQGRPLIDADFNEQTAALLHTLRQAVADVVGPHGGVPETAFKIKPTNEVVDSKPQIASLTIELGRYYVDGFLCENFGSKIKPPPAAPAGQFEPFTFLNQPYYPPPPGDWPNKGKFPIPALVYLDIWEHHRTWIDDVVLADSALGGADTSTRAQVVWQVKVRPLSDFPTSVTGLTDAAKKKHDWKPELEAFDSARGRLMARLDPPKAAAHCGSQLAARYLGVENQLYRVEVHDSGEAWDGTAGTAATSATFKWSRENGSVVAKWDESPKNAAPLSLTIQGPRDQARGFRAGDWVELTDEGRELRGEPGVWVKLSNVEGRRLTFTCEDPAQADRKKFPINPKVRRWDQMKRDDLQFKGEGGAILGLKPPAGSSPTTPVAPGWIELENDIQIQPVSGSGKFRTGDYWLIGARAGTGAIEGPTANDGAEPFGIRHHYAPLLLVLEKDPTKATDLRRKIKPAAEPV